MPVNASSANGFMKRIGFFRRSNSPSEEECDDMMSGMTSYLPGIRRLSDQMDDADLSSMEAAAGDDDEIESGIGRKRKRRRRAVERSRVLAPRIRGFLFSEHGWLAYGPTLFLN